MLVGFSVSEKLSSCEDIVIQSLFVIDLFCVQLVKERQCEFLNLCHMMSYMSLLVCGMGEPQKCGLQKLVKKLQNFFTEVILRSYSFRYENIKF